MPTFKAELSVSSIDALIRDVETYKSKLEATPQKITNSLVNIGVAEIEKNIHDVRDKSGNELAVAASMFFGDTGFACMQGEQAAYLEFGTGEVGASSPHPQADASGWQYASGTRIIPTRSGKRMWKYRLRGTERWTYTAGIPAGMVVLNASLTVRANLIPKAKEALK